MVPYFAANSSPGLCGWLQIAWIVSFPRSRVPTECQVRPRSADLLMPEAVAASNAPPRVDTTAKKSPTVGEKGIRTWPSFDWNVPAVPATANQDRSVAADP